MHCDFVSFPPEAAAPLAQTIVDCRLPCLPAGRRIRNLSLFHRLNTPFFSLKKFSSLVLILLYFGNVEFVQAQGCCTVGASSLGGIESGVQKYRTLSFGLNYQFNSLTRAYQETDKIEDPLRRTASVSYFNLHLEYGLQPKLSLFVTIPFSDKSREITVKNVNSGFTETAKFTTSGIGDLTVLAKYQLIAPSIPSPFELAAGGGVSLPTGSFTKEQNNSQLSIDLQPGTGATTLIAWGFAMRSFPEQGIRFFATATYRYAGTNFDGYRIGDEFVVGLGGEYNLNEHFTGSLHLRSRFASLDYANRRTLNATGGTYHDIMPSISYIDGPSHARVFSQLPIYRNVRGIQLTLAYLLGFEYAYTFDFSGLLSSPMEEEK